MRLKNLELTDDLRARILDVENALALHQSGVDSAAKIEIPKLDLADAVLQAARQQRLDRVPKPVPACARIAPRRRRRA